LDREHRAHPPEGLDEPLWEEVIRQHQEPVFRLLYLMLGDAEEAADAAQETFLRAFRAWDRRDLNRPLRPWLLRIAANLARNRRRAIGRYWRALQRWIQLQRPASGTRDELLETVVRQEEAERLWQAIRRLGLVDQETIYLRYFLELSEAEIAQIQQVAIGTVKSRLHRALHRLRAVVEREFPDLIDRP
jgi:RNA polymerase sigma-70 factor (ECF subfamily)